MKDIKNILHERQNFNMCLCHCRNKESCLLNGKCLKACIAYEAEVSTEGECPIYYATVDCDFRHADIATKLCPFDIKVTQTTLSCHSNLGTKLRKKLDFI